MTLRDIVQRFGKPLAIIILCVFAALTVRKSLPEVAKLHPHNYGAFALGCVLFMVTYLVQAFGWHLLLRALGQPVSLHDSARMYFLSLIAKWVPGRIWFSATRLYIAKQVGLSVTAVAFGIVLELIYILLGGILVSVAFAGALLKGMFSSPHGMIALICLVALIIVAGMLAIRPSVLMSLSRLRVVRKVLNKIAGEELSDNDQPEMSTSSSLMLILYSAVYWLLCGVMFGVLTSSFIPMTPATWVACIPAFAVSWLVGFFSMIAPAGIGIREFAMTMILQQSTGQAAALVMSVASRVVMTFVELILAGLAFLFLKGQLGDMPFQKGKAKAPGNGRTLSPSNGKLPYPMDVTMRMTVNPGLKTPQAPPQNGSQMMSSQPVDASVMSRLSAMASPLAADPSYGAGHNGTNAHVNGASRNGVAPNTSRSMSAVHHGAMAPQGSMSQGTTGMARSHSLNAQRWTLVKRRPCFCGREQTQNGRIPKSHYKPWRKIRVLTEDL